MVLTVKVIGILLIAFSVILLIRPQALKSMLVFVIEQQKMIYFAAVLRLVIGALLLLAASNAAIPIIIIVLGIIFLVSGIMIFFLGVDRVKSIVEKFLDKSDMVYRALAAIPLVVGILLVWAA